MKVVVTMTLKDEELKKIQEKTGFTKPDEIRGYLYGELSNIKSEHSKKYNIDMKVDDELGEIAQDLYLNIGGLFVESLKKEAVTPFKPVKEVKRKAEVGEWIKITDSCMALGLYKDGDIMKVIDTYTSNSGNVVCETKDGYNPAIFFEGYVVLENYEPEEK